MRKEVVKKLYILQLKERGISQKTYDSLSEEEKKLLERKGEKWWLKPEARSIIKVVATGGVFDVLHLGHIRTLKEAKRYGDVLVAIVARDEMVERKGRKPIHRVKERAELVSAVRWVDVVLEGSKNVMETAMLVSPDVVVFGYDQKPFEVPGSKIVQLKEGYRTEDIKTNKIIRGLV